jgi:DNA-binding NarL/FixJ family response regulator
MKVGAERPIHGAASMADPLSVIVSASSTELHRRISDALAEQEFTVSAQVHDADAIAGMDLEASVIAIVGCNVDEAREMATLRRLRREAPKLAIVVISTPATGTGVRRALDAGADALVFDPDLKLTLATTVRAVAIGQSVVPRKFRASIERPILSHREHQVLVLVRDGLTNAEIAERLFLAESTIKSHISSIFTKFGVRSRKEVAAVFINAGAAPEAAVALAEGSDSTATGGPHGH